MFTDVEKTGIMDAIVKSISFENAESERLSEEYCRKNSESHKGKLSPNKGKHLSAETKRTARKNRTNKRPA